MMNRNRERGAVFKICDEPGSLVKPSFHRSAILLDSQLALDLGVREGLVSNI